MDLFFYISDKQLRYFFSFFHHLNEQTPYNHRRKLALSEYKAIKQKQTEWAGTSSRADRGPHLAVLFADHVFLLCCLIWHCVAFALYCRKAYKSFFRSSVGKFLPLEDLSVPGFAAHVAVGDLTLVTKREPPTFGCFLHPFVLNVPPQCNIALLIPLCFPSAHHHQLPVVVTPWCCFPSQHQYNLICK